MERTIILLSAFLFINTSLTHAERLEEVIVTAQKRPEKLIDVPLSITSINGNDLKSKNISDMQSLTDRAPGVSMLETGLSTQVRVRGIGAENSQGFEQSVGLYFDGVSLSRAQAYRLPFFDVERIEVARGIQSTLFGKSSVAGSISIINAMPEPGENLSGGASLNFTPTTDGESFEGFLSGPLGPNLSARFALVAKNDHGYIDNVFNGESGPKKEQRGGRFTLAWDNLNTTKTTLKLESSSLDVTGRQAQIIKDEPASFTLGERYGSLFSGIASTYSNTLQYLFGQPGFESQLDDKRSVDGMDFGHNELNKVLVDFDHIVGEILLESITSYVDLTYEEGCDCDFTPSELIHQNLYESYKQFSQDFRAMSWDEDSSFKWLAGVYYQSSNQDFTDKVDTTETSLLIPIVTGFLARNPMISPDLAPTLANSMVNTGLWRDFKQDAQLYSVYSDFSFDILDNLELKLGNRYTKFHKEGAKQIDIVDLLSGLPVSESSYAPALYTSIFGTHNEQDSGHARSGKRTEYALDTSFTVTFKPSENTLIFASAKNGSKSGGYDPRSNYPEGFEYEGERVRSYELGIKSKVFKNHRYSLIGYRSNFKDLQVSQFDGIAGFNVGNAKETLIQGIELEGVSSLTDSFSLFYSMALMDFEYLDFKNGNCYQGQEPDGTDLDGDGTSDLCDYTSEKARFQPETTFSLGGEYFRNLGFATLSIAGDIVYSGEYNVHANNDPSVIQDEHSIFDLVVALQRDSWQFSVIGSNLTDEQVINYAGNAPLSNLIAGSNTVNAMISKPRTLTLQARYSF